MQLSPDTLAQLSRLIKQWTGLALGPDKAYLIRHRLAPVVRSCGFEGFDDLLLRLQGGGATRIQDAVIEAITTKETSFFRDSWLFDALLNNVLPDLAVSSKQRIRIWSAGTSTGQEAYSLAILALEFLDSRLSAIAQSQFNILASDISAEAIDAAKIGLYSKQEVERGLSDSRTRRFFQHQGDGWMIREALRPMVQFRVMNLLQPPTGVGPFDLVLCRNVLIYFDEPTRAQVCKAMHEMMRKGAWLALGSAESLQGISGGFEAVKFGRAFLYRKI